MPPSVLCVLIVLALFLQACASPAARVESLTPAHVELLDGTPLMLIVNGTAQEENDPQKAGSPRNAVGAGSGILVHPRIIATAAHIVPPDVRSVTVWTIGAASRETAAVNQVIRGQASGFWDGDWALIVLKQPFHSLPARPVRSILDEPLHTGDTLIIAGYPMIAHKHDPSERTPVFLRSVIIPDPPEVAKSEYVYFAGSPQGEPSLVGASGGPVFLSRPEGAAFIGLYGGSYQRKFLGFTVDRSLVILRLPKEAIDGAAGQPTP